MKIERPDILRGPTQQVITGCGNLYVTVNVDPCHGGPVEVFARMGKSGGCAMVQSEALGRLISLALRHGVPVEEVILQVKELKCLNPCWHDGRQVLSCADGVAQAMERFMELGHKAPAVTEEEAA